MIGATRNRDSSLDIVIGKIDSFAYLFLFMRPVLQAPV